MKFRIVRYFSDGRVSETVKIVSSLKEAQQHCTDPKTSGALKDGTKWFDGYTRRGTH